MRKEEQSEIKKVNEKMRGGEREGGVERETEGWRERRRGGESEDRGQAISCGQKNRGVIYRDILHTADGERKRGRDG